MLIYLGMFIIVTLLTKIVQQLFEQDKKKPAIILSIIIILIPSIISGVRDTSIGTDVNEYVGPDFYYATKSESIGEYFEKSKEEPLYTLLNYIISRFTSDVHYILFTVQLIMTTLVYISIYRQRKKIPMWISMLVYMVLIYTRFLNLIRQGIAVCIIIFAFSYVENKKTIKFAISIILATLFHRTAILALPIYILYWLINKDDKKSNMALIVSYVMLIISVFCYDLILEWLLNWNILPDKFEVYLSRFKNSVWDVNVFLTLFKGMWIIAILLSYKELKKNDANARFLFNMLLIDMILLQFSIKIKQAERLSYYYGCIGHLFLIPQIPKAFSEGLLNKLPRRVQEMLPMKLKDEKIIRIIVNIAIILLLVIYFYWCFIYHSAGEIYPYKSKILGI